MVMEGAVHTVSTSAKRKRFKRVCVFCGAYNGDREVFQGVAMELGKELVKRDIGLVYGGGNLGLMGMVSKEVIRGGQPVIGVIPTALKQIAMTEELTGIEVVEVASMHERKAVMSHNADAFIALPGGYGTLEELLEVISWAQLGIHDKPVGLLNVEGYYDSLLSFVDNAVKEGFIAPSAKHIFVVSTSAKDLVTKLEEYASYHDKVASQQSWEMHGAVLAV